MGRNQGTRESDKGRRTSRRGTTVRCGAGRGRTGAQNGSSPDRIPRLVFFGFPFARCAILTFFSIAQYNFGFPFASTIALCFEGCPYSKTSLTRDPTTTTKPARVLYTVFA